MPKQRFSSVTIRPTRTRGARGAAGHSGRASSKEAAARTASRAARDSRAASRADGASRVASRTKTKAGRKVAKIQRADDGAQRDNAKKYGIPELTTFVPQAAFVRDAGAVKEVLQGLKAQAARLNGIRSDINQDSFALLQHEIKNPAWVAEFADNLKALILAKRERYATAVRPPRPTNDNGEQVPYVGDTYDALVKVCDFIDKTYFGADKPTRDKWLENVRTRLHNAVNGDKGLASIAGATRADARNVVASVVRTLRTSYKLFMESYMNIMMLGNAGTGKTTIASVIGNVFYTLLIVLRPPVLYTAANFISPFQGGTPTQVVRLLHSAIDSVIFIDEAYSLAGCAGNATKPVDKRGESYHDQGITELVNFLSNFKGQYMMIVAGYTAPMLQCFLGSNQGLPRRFPPDKRFVLPDYDTNTLMLILKGQLALQLSGVESRLAYPIGLSNAELSIVSDVVEVLNADGVLTGQGGDMEALASSIATEVINFVDDFSGPPSGITQTRRLLLLEKAVQRFLVGRPCRIKLEPHGLATLCDVKINGSKRSFSRTSRSSRTSSRTSRTSQ